MYVRPKPTWSWHIERDDGKTLCGRRIGSTYEHAVELPMDERSCESCLRLRDREAAPEVSAWPS